MAFPIFYAIYLPPSDHPAHRIWQTVKVKKLSAVIWWDRMLHSVWEVFLKLILKKKIEDDFLNLLNKSIFKNLC